MVLKNIIYYSLLHRTKDSENDEINEWEILKTRPMRNVYLKNLKLNQSAYLVNAIYTAEIRTDISMVMRISINSITPSLKV